MGAVLAYRNRVVAVGQNSTKSHPLAAKYSKNEKAICLHAEIDAIKNALKVVDVEDLNKMTLYVARVKRTGLIGNAKPCNGCQRAIETFGIGSVVWTEDE